MRRTSTLSAGLLVLAGLLAAPPTARAEEKKSPLAGQPAIRHKLELRKRRFEITPQFMVSLNQDFRHYIGGGLVLDYHINDWLGIALQFAYGTGIDTGLTGATRAKLTSESAKPYTPTNCPTNSDNRPCFQPTTEQFVAHLATINLLTSLYAQVTPMAGKVSLFSALFLRYDLYAVAGFGLLSLSNTWGSYNGTKMTTGCTDPKTNPDPNLCDPLNSGIKAAFMWGVGLHLFFNEFIGLNLELRDFVASTNMGGLDVNGDRALTSADNTISNNLFVGAGLTFMLPLHPAISN